MRWKSHRTLFFLSLNDFAFFLSFELRAVFATLFLQRFVCSTRSKHPGTCLFLPVDNQHSTLRLVMSLTIFAMTLTFIYAPPTFTPWNSALKCFVKQSLFVQTRTGKVFYLLCRRFPLFQVYPVFVISFLSRNVRRFCRLCLVRDEKMEDISTPAKRVLEKDV